MVKFIQSQGLDNWNTSLRCIKFRQRFSGLILSLIISVFFLAFLVQAASAQMAAQSLPVNKAPLNPEFIAWQRKRSTSNLEMLEQEDNLQGCIPSTFDWSHLRFEKVSDVLFNAIPARFDLRDLDHVTSVKDKGSCGCCWSFATYGSLESWLKKNKEEEWNFSENHLKNHHGFDPAPCEGGYPEMSIAYLTRWSGPVSESDDPYHPWDDRPSSDGPCQKYVKTVLIFTTEDEIKNAIMTYGGLFARMYWKDSYYNSFYHTYYYNGNENQQHAVTLIGWDDNKTVPGAPAEGAWIAKNDFGKVWGENGYFYVSYFDSKAVQSSNPLYGNMPYAVAFCDAVPISTYISNYQHDPLGHKSAIGSGNTTTFWGANIFTATADEYLGAVGFYALSKNTSYEIHVYDNFYGFQFYDLLGSVSGTVMYPGYHTVTLPSPINLINGDDFGIVIKFTTPGYFYPVAIEEPIEDRTSDATANPGESYYSSYGECFWDITDESDFENANICIKGLTIPAPAYIDIGLRVYNGRETIIIACEPEGTLTSPLRIRKNGVTYGIVLVGPSDANASGIRVQTTSGVKALRKY